MSVGTRKMSVGTRKMSVGTRKMSVGTRKMSVGTRKKSAHWSLLTAQRNLHSEGTRLIRLALNPPGTGLNKR